MDFKVGKVYIGSDVLAYEVKEQVVDYVKSLNYLVVDLGVFAIDEQADYPDIAREVSEKVLENEAGHDFKHDGHNDFTLGILISETGIDMSIAANKFNGIRAVVCTSQNMAEKSRENNDANILCLAFSESSFDDMKGIIDSFITTCFSGDEACTRSLNKVA